MDIRKFQNISVIEDMTQLVNPKVGTCFLHGAHIVAQMEDVSLGNNVTWYEVVSVDKKGNFSYAPRYGRLTKPTEEV